MVGNLLPFTQGMINLLLMHVSLTIASVGLFSSPVILFFPSSRPIYIYIATNHI
uniref:Uncharacterized protein n=1 Tax=Arundo donax TaxID=35708 RepID=A0A0A9G056_ARUDO